ncbi:MAG: cryptochrome/photolyase family protein [Flavobacteriales bacterium]
MKQKISIHWFRRDLRLDDNASLWAALKSGAPVLPIFIFDKYILDKLENKQDARVHFIHNTITSLDAQLRQFGSALRVFYDTPENVYKQLLDEYAIHEVWTNRDYETYAQERDQKIFNLLHKNNVAFKGKKDHVIFEKNEVLKDDGKPYTVFTPYSRKWKSKLTAFHTKAYPTLKYANSFFKTPPFAIPTLGDMGFEASTIEIPSSSIPISIIEKYDKTRDIPSMHGTTRLSIHLRFGTLSIRQLTSIALDKNETWLNELIWRDFYQMIIHHFPHSEKDAFKLQYDKVEWINDEKGYALWCAGKTGYPIVDAGIRELNATGFMHNRVRMIVASFLTKHLLIDWRWGERYFASKLLDYEAASNVGGWQWAAGSGCDAAPYFRIFNPTSQTEKFDKEKRYIKRWVPEYGTTSYPKPCVDHVFARNRCLETYKKALKS